MKNPIYVEFYSHEHCLCYKVKNPWTKYREEVYVLCKVSEGLELARQLAYEYLIQKLRLALNNEPITK